MMVSPNETTLCRHQKSCLPFLLLPAELRNYIYHLALTDDSSVIDMGNKKPTFRSGSCYLYRKEARDYQGGTRTSTQADEQPRSTGRAFALLRTCKQIYIEGYKIYYGCNTFSFDSQAFYDFFERPGHLGTRVTDEIKRAHILLYQYPISEQLAEMSVYSKIEQLNLSLPGRLLGDESYSCALPRDILRFPYLIKVSLSRFEKAMPIESFEQDRQYQVEANDLLMQRYMSNIQQTDLSPSS